MEKDQYDWKKKLVWVIGASEGFGAQLALDLYDKGARIVVSSRRAEVLAKRYQGFSERLKIEPLNVEDRTAIRAAVHGMDLAESVPDVVIFCAAIYEPGGIFNLSEQSLVEHTAINYLGAVMVAKNIIDVWAKNKTAGHLCLVGSVAGYRGMKNAIAYNPNKAALKSFAECLALDLKKSPISVSIAEPGFIRTRLTQKNTFAMPFIISVQEASRKLMEGIERGNFEISYPKKMVWILKVLRILPFWIYKRLW